MYRKNACYDALKSVLARVLEQQSRGVRPRGGRYRGIASHFTAEQIETGIRMGQQDTMAAAMRSLTTYELAWRVDTADVRDAKRRTIEVLLTRRLRKHRQREKYANLTAEKRRIVDTYQSKHGAQRKRYRRRHWQTLKSAEVIYS